MDGAEFPLCRAIHSWVTVAEAVAAKVAASATVSFIVIIINISHYVPMQNGLFWKGDM